VSAFRRVCRWLHRELGFFAVGLTLVYAVSGIAVNHVHHWDPNRTEQVEILAAALSDTTSIEAVVADVRPLLSPDAEIRVAHKLPSGLLRIITDNKSQYDVDLATGVVRHESFRRRPVLFEMNFMHLNTGKGFWTWTADIYAVLLIILALTGIFLVKGRKGLAGRGGVLMALGVLLPLVYALLAVR
jgi:hypothetical protein